jgi:outer membrane murein-binding lipoprotein Lpp
MDDNLLKLFIAVTTFAVLVQAGILVGLYLAVRKSAAKMEALATQVTDKTVPTMETVQSMLAEMRPQISVLTTNLTESSNLLRNQLGRIDATLTDTLDRTRLQVIRADELLNRTMDKVEETSEVVHKTVISPLRQIDGLMAAISTGFEVFLGQKRRQPKNGAGVPQDEMFI